MDRKRLKFNVLLAGGLFLLFGIPNFFNAGWFQRLEAPLYDVGASLWMKRGAPAELEIVMVGLDQEGCAASAPSGCSGEIIGQVVSLLSMGKAKVIGIDLPLGKMGMSQGLRDLLRIQERIREYRRGRQTDCVPEWLKEDLSRLDSRLDFSAGLARQMTQAHNTIIAISASREKPEKGKQRETATNPSLEKSFLHGENRGASLPLPYQVAGDLDLPATSLCEAAMGLGHKLSTLKPGLLARAHPIVANYEGHLLPSFALRVALAYLDLSPKEVRVSRDDLLLGNRRIPLYDGDMLVPPLGPKHAIHRLLSSELLAAQSIPKTCEGKIALIGLVPPMDQAPRGTIGDPDPVASAAWVVQTILKGSWIERPDLAHALEMAALLLLLVLGAILCCIKKESMKVLTLSGLALITLSVGVATLFTAGIWIRTVHMAMALGVMYLVVGIGPFFAPPGLRRELEDTHKLLGLHYSRQGDLDQAFDEYRKCRKDPEIKELLYDLGRTYEKKALLTQALRSYETLREMGKYKDTDERIAKLGAPGNPLPFEIGDRARKQAMLSESFVNMNKAVGRYQIISELGKGTMGVVYKAKDPKINRFVAIKVIRFSDDFEEEVRQEVKNRFLREAEIAGQLSHPSIITVFDVGEDQDLTYMAMECLEGRSLSHYCRKESLLPVPRAVEIVENIAGALDHAHKANVIHRDIKPANIMILQDGGVKVTDFGIAKAVSSSLTKTGIVLGTPNYMSPEQIMGHKIGPQTDIFSLGVLFFNLVTGDLPFRGEKLNTLLYQITQTRHPSVRSIHPALPKAIEQIIDKALAKNPDNRFKSAGEMAKYLGLLRKKIDQTVQARSGSEPGSAQRANSSLNAED